MPELGRHTIVADVVTENPASARVFQKHGIDYCCRGNVSVEAACERDDLDTDAVLAELAAALANGPANPDEDPRTLSTAALLARIVDRHHGYLRRTLPYVAPIAAKVAKVHGARDARLIEIAESYQALAASLIPHLDEEEEVLFPALVQRRPDAQLVTRELSRMLTEHLAVGDLLARIRKLTDGFVVPEWGCNTYRVLMSELEAIEADILRHVHLENHVLAPRFATLAAAQRISTGAEATA